MKRRARESKLRTPEPQQKRAKEVGREDPPGNEAACRCLLTERENFLQPTRETGMSNENHRRTRHEGKRERPAEVSAKLLSQVPSWEKISRERCNKEKARAMRWNEELGDCTHTHTHV